MRVSLPGASHSRILLLEDIGKVWHSVSLQTEVVAAEVCADWREQEACVLCVHPQVDRKQIVRTLSHYWPSLTIVWPEDVEVTTITQEVHRGP